MCGGGGLICCVIFLDVTTSGVDCLGRPRLVSGASCAVWRELSNPARLLVPVEMSKLLFTWPVWCRNERRKLNGNWLASVHLEMADKSRGGGGGTEGLLQHDFSVGHLDCGLTYSVTASREWSYCLKYVQNNWLPWSLKARYDLLNVPLNLNQPTCQEYIISLWLVNSPYRACHCAKFAAHCVIYFLFHVFGCLPVI